MNNIDKARLINNIDYIKLLIEEDRYGEAYDMLQQEQIIINSNNVNNLQSLELIDEIEISKEQLNIRPGNYINVENIWIKLIAKDKEKICLSIDSEKIIEKKYKIKK